MNHATAIRAFDVRERGRSFSTTWLNAKWEQYAPRLSRGPVLSADPMIWPSIVTGSVAEDFRVRGRARAGRAGVTTGLPALLTSEDDACEAAALLRSQGAPEGSVVAVTVLDSADRRDSPAFSIHDAWLGCPSNEQLDRWRLIGFDLCDSGSISGLWNYGYTNVERESAIREVSPKLNRFGLVESEALAFEVRAWTARRLPNEWFNICGVYLTDGSDPETVWDA